MRSGPSVPDAVVVGAGHNGLVAANMLADAGWQVLVLEATDRPGGGVRSAELVAPGYLSDLCSAFYPLAACSPALAALDLPAYGLRWRHAPRVLAHVLPDDRAVVLSREVAETAASVDAFAAGDGDRWAAAAADWDRFGDQVTAALLSPFPPVRAGIRVLRDLRAAGAARLARRLLLPARTLAAELFRGEGARAMLTGLALHTDLTPLDAASGVYGWLLAMLGQRHGFPVPAGGAQRLTDALVARLLARHGKIVYGVRVARIDTAHGRATGVSAADGRRWPAARAVLADVPAPALYLNLIGPERLPAGLADDMTRFQWDGATVKLDWALSEPIPWSAGEAVGAGTVHLGGDVAGLTRASLDLADGRVPDRPFVLVGQMTTADPSRSPAGTECAWAYTHLPHRSQWTAAEVADCAGRLEDLVEQHAPGFAKTVVARVVSGPAELEQENPSLVGGALNGGTSAAYQQLFLRPVPGLGRADTPIDRLYLASASAHPGGGVHGAPGANAARAALARERPVTGPFYGAAIRRTQRALYGG
ncbi:NAD(P)/FAD-dependent oxidoreductase [Hamadaea sp. NPDC050747]|uniref:phytoene desaturase family protein n=1 Tax=Hamadaea sp. NPDC050747 TaxID=3155789 RepID=UPI0033F3D170